MAYSKAERQESLETLLAWVRPGDTVFTILRHVSRNGMSRIITPLVMVEAEPRYLTYHAARVLGRRDKDDGVVCQGAGMDMGFALIYDLGQALFSDGYALRQRWL